MRRPRLVALVGPTASGKSALGIELAERVGGEIVSADARQIYRGLDVGTAKPTPEEQARVRHHCLDLVDPGERYDVARWAGAAEAAIERLSTAGRPVIVVGGTGLYVRVLLRGLCVTPEPLPELRRALVTLAETRGDGELRRWLGRLDPDGAARIHPNDRVRTMRALEVVLQGGHPLSASQASHAFGGDAYDAQIIVLDVPTNELESRIEQRADSMLAGGWRDEVVRLMHAVPDDAPAWETLGYRELRAHLRGEHDLETTRQAIVTTTRRFAKRQRTWWRRETREGAGTWRDPGVGREGILAETAAFLVAKHPPAG